MWSQTRVLVTIIYSRGIELLKNIVLYLILTTLVVMHTARFPFQKITRCESNCHDTFFFIGVIILLCNSRYFSEHCCVQDDVPKNWDTLKNNYFSTT